MVGELLAEIMTKININAFNFNLDETVDRLIDFISNEKNYVFVAQDELSKYVGFLTMFEGFALYTEGAFGVIPELYIRQEYRSKNIGKDLLSQAQAFAN